MQDQTQALIALDKTTDGWYTSSGLSSLPSELKTRLFKIGVANEVDSGKTGELDYGYYVNNHYYLTSTVYQRRDQHLVPVRHLRQDHDHMVRDPGR
jgi:phage-related tail fiber protein